MAVTIIKKPAQPQPVQSIAPVEAAVIPALPTAAPESPPDATTPPPSPYHVTDDDGTPAKVVWPFPQGEKPAQVSKMLQALTAEETKEDAPWDAPENYTILDALKEYAERKHVGKTLRLIATKNGGTTYTVKGYDMPTGRCNLEGPGGMQLKPKITEREVPLYTPFWS